MNYTLNRRLGGIGSPFRLHTAGGAVHPGQERTMTSCDHCGAHVSDQFARVFGNGGGQVLACPNCSANAGIAKAVLERDRAT